MLSAFGVDSGPADCDDQEEWDWQQLSCVAKGTALSPTPSLPPSDPSTTPVSIPSGPPMPQLPPPGTPVQTQPVAPQEDFLTKYKTPLIIGGAVLGGIVLISLLSGGGSYAANPSKREKARRRMHKRRRRFGAKNRAHARRSSR